MFYTKFIKMKMVIIFLLLFVQNSIFSQTNDRLEDRYWVNLGANYGIADKNEGKAVSLSLPIGVVYARGKSKYEIRYSYLIVNAIFNGKNFDRFNRYDILVGRGKVRRGYYFMFSGGISLFQDITYYKIREDYYILSFPLELELFLKPSKYGGLGIALSVDLNSKMSMISLGARFGFGKMK